MRRYFISFVNNKGENTRFSWRVVHWNGDFNLEEVTNFLEKENKCKEVVILFFRELAKHEIAVSTENPKGEGK